MTKNNKKTQTTHPVPTVAGFLKHLKENNIPMFKSVSKKIKSCGKDIDNMQDLINLMLKDDKETESLKNDREGLLIIAQEIEDNAKDISKDVTPRIVFESQQKIDKLWSEFLETGKYMLNLAVKLDEAEIKEYTDAINSFQRKYVAELQMKREGNNEACSEEKCDKLARVIISKTGIKTLADDKPKKSKAKKAKKTSVKKAVKKATKKATKTKATK